MSSTMITKIQSGEIEIAVRYDDSDVIVLETPSTMYWLSAEEALFIGMDLVSAARRLRDRES